MNNLYSKSYDIKISFKGDDLVIFGEIPLYLKNFYHKSSKEFTRFLPCDFFDIISILNQRKITFKTTIKSDFDLSYPLTPTFNLRDYQKDAIDQWFSKNYCGTIILPTGAGKTVLGLATIQKIRKKTLIIVPTVDLLNQWTKSFIWFKEFLNENFELIGQYGGGKKDLRPITVSTYESARLYSRKLRDKFGFLIFDEVHHLSGKQWREIARAYIAPYRLGLTATLNPQDEGFESIITYIGQIVFTLTPQELQEIGAISHYELRKKFVILPTDLQKEYNSQIKIFNDYVKKKGLFGKKGFQRLLYRYNDPTARHALEAHRKSREIAFNASGKLQAITEIFRDHSEEQILLFCESIPFIEKISVNFFIPMISSRTPTKERKKILRDFKEGKIRIIAAGRVLDEGIDVKASIGVIISGSAQERQFIQRLGRLLRPHHENKRAILYEIITQYTSEEKTADRRKITS